MKNKEKNNILQQVMKNMTEKQPEFFAPHRVRSMIKNAGADRVSPSASDELNRILSKRGLEIVHSAVKFATGSGRSTVKEVDILAALESGDEK